MPGVPAVALMRDLSTHAGSCIRGHNWPPEVRSALLKPFPRAAVRGPKPGRTGSDQQPSQTGSSTLIGDNEHVEGTIDAAKPPVLLAGLLPGIPLSLSICPCATEQPAH